MREKIEEVVNLYDLLIMLYEAIEPHETTYIREFEASTNCFLEALSLLNEEDLTTISPEHKQQVLGYFDQYQYSGKALVGMFKAIITKHGLAYNLSEKYRNKSYPFITISNVQPLNTNTAKFLIYPVERTVLVDLIPVKQRIRFDCLIGTQIENFLIGDIDEFSGLLIYRKEGKGDIAHQIKRLYDPTFEEVREKFKQKFRIASIPLLNNPGLIQIHRDKTRGKIMVSLQQENLVKDKIIHVLKTLAGEKIDIILLPELSLTPMILSEVQEFLKTNEHDYTFIVPGSIWENKTNTAYLLNRNGDILITQRKMNPFRCEEIHDNIKYEYTEDLDAMDRVVNVLDIPGFGRANIFICADLVLDKFVNVTKELGINHFFGVLFSKSLTRFKTSSAKLTASNFASVCIANCCCSITEGNDIIFHDIPLKHKNPSRSFLNDEKYNVKEKDFCKCRSENIHDFCYRVTDIEKVEIITSPEAEKEEFASLSRIKKRASE